MPPKSWQQRAKEEELASLEADAEIPLEQLLAMYGLSKDQLEGDAPGLKDDDSDAEEDEDSTDAAGVWVPWDPKMLTNRNSPPKLTN